MLASKGVFCLLLFYSATARHEQDAKRLRMAPRNESGPGDGVSGPFTGLINFVSILNMFSVKDI